MVNFVTFLTACLLCSSTAESINGFVRHEKGPQGKWVSLENGNQVLVADESHQTQNLSPEKQAALDEIRSRFLDEQATATPSSNFWDKTKEFTKNSWDKTKETWEQTKETLGQIKKSGSMEQPRMDIVDSSETFYNEYAQAWRLMGFYIDCNADQDDHRRELEGEDGGGCMRYLLWAAYVDLDYSGYGLGEYQIWDHEKDHWDGSTCGKTGGSRCVKMDCHLPETHYSLIGYFKEPNYKEWMEQLFKHEGVCAWDFWDDEDTYGAMQGMRETWPEECTAVYLNGEYIYFDIAPQPKGSMDIGLYTDSRCSVPYTKKDVTVKDVLQYYMSENADDDYNADDDANDNPNDNDDPDYYYLEKHIQIWNEAFDIWKTCNPCKAYDLQQTTADGDGGGDDNDDADNKGLWGCDDDAGYHNVNQCMKFATHTEMLPATYRDVMMASEQGMITSFTSGNHVFGNVYKDAGLFLRIGEVLGGIAVFTFGCFMMYRASKVSKTLSMQYDLKQPFVTTDEKEIS